MQQQKFYFGLSIDKFDYEIAHHNFIYYKKYNYIKC